MEKKKEVPAKVMEDLGIKLPATDVEQNTNIQMYKEHLSLLIARGKTKEFIGKTITYADLDRMSAKDLEKYYKLYETAQASRINQAITNGVINAYTKLCGFLIKPDDQRSGNKVSKEKQLSKLNNDLKNDFLVTNQLELWTSYLNFNMSGFMSILSATLITFENLHSTNTEITKNLSILNGGEQRDKDNRGKQVDSESDTDTKRDKEQRKSRTKKHQEDRRSAKTKNSETD